MTPATRTLPRAGALVGLTALTVAGCFPFVDPGGATTGSSAGTSSTSQPHATTGSSAGTDASSSAGASGDTEQTTATLESCGDGLVDPGEECDGTNLAGATCQSEGFGKGGLLCNPDCTLDTQHCSSCGDGALNGEEECDGVLLGAHETCADVGLGTAEQPLGCDDSCAYDFSACDACGDGVIMDPESCEPAGDVLVKPNLGGQTCVGLGYEGGLLECTGGCGFDTSGCHTCGDAVKQAQEQCDGADFGGKSCASFDSAIGDPFDAGSLSCSDDCGVETYECSLCGDGVTTGAELCDPLAPNPYTCAMYEEYDNGVLTCPDCSAYDFSMCTKCGNGLAEAGEQCDQDDLQGASCLTLGYDGGALACTGGCKLDESGCANNFCGDGMVTDAEKCDCGEGGDMCTPAQLDGVTCESLGHDGGALACNTPFNCMFDESGCYDCGDGELNAGEACDGNNLGGETCASQGFYSGALACDDSCELDTSMCNPPPNPLTACVSPMLAITGAGPGAANPAVISIPWGGTVTDVDVFVDCLHVFPGDLGFTVTHLGASSVILHRPGVPATMVGCGVDNIDAVFDDEALAPAEDECAQAPPAIGSPPSFRPLNPLTAFDGLSVTGDWKLIIDDHDALQSDGQLLEWCVSITWE
ncbi:MAG: hypothetical protein H6713_36660 [Myxococcales bacterium]|nr:hypothetical protein [Myxococcales bacterium]MCB9755497.1 hypothetical protein [Myxococcales bacterium]